jgi:three-Cys-motif partner protein
MDTDTFFDKPLEQSRVKTRIVAKYFASWANVMVNGAKTEKIGYFDLYAGPGVYQDGFISTPLQVLECAIKTPLIAQKLVTIFNDIDKVNCEQLEKSISVLPNIGNLKYKPKVYQSEVNSDITEFFNKKKIIPSILFLDPWGYKGISLDLINAVVKDWGCECIFFFNFRRVNAALNTPIHSDNVNLLFGTERANNMRSELQKKPDYLKPVFREEFILNQLVEALKGKRNNSRYVLKFKVKSSIVDSTSHYLIYVTKGFKGYAIMKDIMAKESIKDEHGIAKYEYCENITSDNNMQFSFMNPHESLAEEIYKNFSGQMIKFEELYEKHCPNTPFIKQDYRTALTILESRGKITVFSAAEKKRRKGTFGESCEITFGG